MTSQTNIPGVGFGLLHPKSPFRFIVRFTDLDGQPLDYSDDLNRQLSRISEITQKKETGFCHFGSFTIEDDMMNVGASAVQKLFAEESFNIEITTTDGNETILDKMIVHRCVVEQITHSEFDYGAGRTETTAYYLINPTLVGSDIEVIKQDATAFAIYTALKSMRFEADKNLSTKYTGRVQKEVSFTYSNVTWTPINTPSR